MGYAGPDWDTAGALTPGGTNTFNAVDGTSDTLFGLNHLGWWTWTAPTSGSLRLEPTPNFVLPYRGADFASKVLLSPGPGDGFDYPVAAGDVYHVAVGRFGSSPSSYTLVATFTPDVVFYSPWLRPHDESDNYVIVTEGDRRLDNPNPAYSGIPFSERPEWMDQVLRDMQGRSGDYLARQDVPGPDPSTAALNCVIDHAFQGDSGSWYFHDDCPALPADPAIAASATPGAETFQSLENHEYVPGFPPDLGSAQAQVYGPARAAWMLPVRDNMPPRGALGYPQSENYGYPAGLDVEFEDVYCTLLRVELAEGDANEDAEYQNDWAVNSRVAPHWGVTGPTDSTPWLIGDISQPPESPEPHRPYMIWNTDPAHGVWHTLPGSAGWDGHDWTEDWPFVPDVKPSTVDAVIIAWPAEFVCEPGQTKSRWARPALKFVLRSSRFRFVSPVPLPVASRMPPRRSKPRHQLTTATRGRGGRDDLQSGGRGRGAVV